MRGLATHPAWESIAKLEESGRYDNPFPTMSCGAIRDALEVMNV